jgi:hypothetical protein
MRPNPFFPNKSLNWTSSAVNNTRTGLHVPGTAFNYSIAASTTMNQSVNWTITVPKGVGPTTFLKFDWNGTVGKGTSAGYQLYNITRTQPTLVLSLVLNVTRIGPPYPFNFPGGPPLNATGGVPVSCALTDECYDLTRFAGDNMTLAFLLNSNSTGTGLKIRVSNIEIATVAAIPSLATFHSMSLNSSNMVTHNANLTLTYNATVTYKSASGLSKVHEWNQTVTTYYFPASYNPTGISLNGTTALWANPPPLGGFPIAQGSCSAAFCKNVRFIALNVTILAQKLSNAVVQSTSAAAEAAVQTTLGGVPTNFWVPGDTLQVRINDIQGVNVTGSNIVAVKDPNSLVLLNQTFSPPSRGLFLFNFSSVLPQSPLGGNWNVTSMFTNSYDYGVVFHVFRVEQVQVNQGSFSYSGDNNRLTVNGALSYGSNSTTKPANVAGNIFAVDSRSGPAPVRTPTITSGTSKGVYISNVTLVDGVFTFGESLIMTFTLVNPPSSGPVDVNATVDHEWTTGQTHGASVNIPLTLGDQPFTLSASNSYVYRLNATLTIGGIRLVVTSLARGNSVTVNIPAGIPPVTSVRQHSGLFKITVTSKTRSTPSPCGSITCTNSLESPTYAYVLVNPPMPGRLLASAPFTTISDGTFTASITSGGELGARNLVFLALGQDSNGVVIKVQDRPTPESTLLQASIDNIPTATAGQAVTVTLHLTANSTVVNMNITVSLDIDGKGVVQSQSGIYIPHGAKKDVAFSFNAPSVGVHSLTFFSPEYGAPLVMATLQVSVLQSNLQVIIPAIIGLAAAIVMLLFFLFRKKPQAVSEPSAKDKPSAGKTTKPSPGSSSSKSLT